MDFSDPLIWFFKYSTLIYRNSISDDHHHDVTNSVSSTCYVLSTCQVSSSCEICKMCFFVDNLSPRKQYSVSVSADWGRQTVLPFRQPDCFICPAHSIHYCGLAWIFTKVCFLKIRVFSQLEGELKHILVCNVTYFTLFTLHDKLHIFPTKSVILWIFQIPWYDFFNIFHFDLS